MRARSPHEPHRAATPLELFFDLVFVVAIAQAAAGLHHAVAEGHAVQGLVSYFMVFFAIWWAWMNFTWFASAYDCDDVPYRIAVFVQLAGALILAAGVPTMFGGQEPNRVIVFGYAVMRLAAVAQWLRAAASDPERRTTARRYALGITVLQIGWIDLTFLPQIWLAGYVVLAMAELAVPVWAARAGPTTWHPQHIAERYSSLTLIVLGESILSANLAVQSSLAAGEALSPLAEVIAGGLRPHCRGACAADALHRPRRAVDGGGVGGPAGGEGCGQTEATAPPDSNNLRRGRTVRAGVRRQRVQTTAGGRCAAADPRQR